MVAPQASRALARTSSRAPVTLAVRTFTTVDGPFFVACERVGDGTGGEALRLRECGWAASRPLDPALLDAPNAPRLWPELVERLKAAIAGEPVDFADIEIPAAAPFFTACRRAVQAVPAGTTISYVELARRAGSPSASRAAGQAMRRNPTPIVVPCHRVVTADGRLGGFAGDWSDASRGESDLLLPDSSLATRGATGLPPLTEGRMTSVKARLLARERAFAARS